MSLQGLSLSLSTFLSLCFSVCRRMGDDQMVSEVPLLLLDEALEPRQTEWNCRPRKGRCLVSPGPVHQTLGTPGPPQHGNPTTVWLRKQLMSPGWLAEL